MLLKLLLVTSSLDSRITSRLCERQLHWLVKKLESLNFVDGFLSGIDGVENNECLSLSFQVFLGYDIDNLAVLRENLTECLLQLLDLDALLEVADINPGKCVSSVTDVSVCNDTYVALGGGVRVAIADVVYY